MKKHNEGYALVLVLVVITVLSLVAMAMTAASLRNLQNQQKSIERMEAKYTAQGEIEKVIAQLDALIKEDGSTQSVKVSELNDKFDSALKLITTTNQDEYFHIDQYYLLTLKAEATVKEKKVTVECEIRITGSIATDEDDKQILLEPRWEYISYTITEGGGS